MHLSRRGFGAALVKTTLTTHCHPSYLSEALQTFFGPFTVRRHVGAMAYDLNLPPVSRIHLDFHVSQLWAYLGRDPQAYFTQIPSNLPVSTLLGEEKSESLSGNINIQKDKEKNLMPLPSQPSINSHKALTDSQDTQHPSDALPTLTIQPSPSDSPRNSPIFNQEEFPRDPHIDSLSCNTLSSGPPLQMPLLHWTIPPSHQTVDLTYPL